MAYGEYRYRENLSKLVYDRLANMFGLVIKNKVTMYRFFCCQVVNVY